MTKPVSTMWTAARAFAALILLAFGCCVASAQCSPSFPLETGKTNGWQGADAAYSIPLPDGRDVWIFGDTLYGRERAVSGHDPRQVHNSLGISTCKGGKWNLQYVLKNGNGADPFSFFSPADPQHWYWALDGFYANGSLWVTLLCIRHAQQAQPWAMDFETCGSDLAQISHLDRDPQQWQVDVRPLVADGVHAYPSASTVVHDGYAYLFALYEKGKRPLLATRVALHQLPDAANQLEYLSLDGTWKHGFDPEHARPVMEQGSSELSIRFHPRLHRWVAVTFSPAWMSPTILLRTAPSLTGPWTEGEPIYSVPEMQTAPHGDANIFCYAAKEHPEFEKSANDLLFTYVCNTMDVKSLPDRLDIYHPQVVKLQIPNAQFDEPSSDANTRAIGQHRKHAPGLGDARNP